MESIEYMSIYNYIDIKNPKGKIIICVDKMSRIFFISENKIYSLAFPFKVVLINEEYSFYINWKLCNQSISWNIKSIILDEKYESESLLVFIEDIYEIEENIESDFWKILKDIMTYEDAYIRYDFDPITNQKFKDLWIEHQHPLNHYDIFYSNKWTFKIWLKSKVSDSEFLNLLNLNTDCDYIN